MPHLCCNGFRRVLVVGSLTGVETAGAHRPTARRRAIRVQMGAGIMFENSAPVKIPLQQVYQHDGDYDRCGCGRRKLRSDSECGACRDGVF